MNSISWLHLTDLHLGMAVQGSFLPTVKDRFFEDLKHLHTKCGPWDLVLFTGDLTQRGAPEEFQKVDAFLGELWRRLGELGSQPLLLAVPGNHDLVRPEPKMSAVRLLRSNWSSDADLRTEFWADPNSESRRIVTTSFENYSKWWANAPYKLSAQPGDLPGDFSAVFKKAGVSVGIVGLNSTFLQLTNGDYKGKLALHAGQFQKVCGGDGPAWVRQCNVCLLLTHQPPDWLTPESKEQLQSEIASPDYFAVHLFGHMHEARYTSTAEGGVPPRRSSQGMSLFGLEHFGEEQKVVRLHGYAAGRIELDGEKGSLMIWPRRAFYPGGQWNFAAAVDDFKLVEEHTLPEEFRLQKPVPPLPATQGDGEQPQEAPPVRPPFRNKWAVLVGVNDYQHFTQLHFCRQDVIDLATAFRETLGFQNVFEFHEKSELQPDRDSIFLKLGNLRDGKKVKEDDLFVFYFSGHGINEGGLDYLLPIRARPRDVKTLGIRIQDLADSIKEIGCKNNAMFIDACREAVVGAKGTASIGEESKETLRKAGIVTFFSCDAKDRSYEVEELKHGSFTYCLLQAIREGAATTVAELDTYLQEKVPQVNLGYNKRVQQPFAVYEDAKQGRLEILFNPCRRQQATQKFGPLMDRLNELVDAGTITTDDFIAALEFLDRVKEKKQLDRNETTKLSLVQSLCNGLSSETFRLSWKRVESGRRAEPQIKKVLPPLT